jgi:hypothetical protein
MEIPLTVELMRLTGGIGLALTGPGCDAREREQPRNLIERQTLVNQNASTARVQRRR